MNEVENINALEADETNFSPVMRQYIGIKKRYPDYIILFRLGDFYEMFMQDAIAASKILEIVLTGRDGGAGQRIPMCGIPHSQLDAYAKKLIGAGCKAAVCEQLTDPAESKGLVERDVVRIITPGTLTGSGMLDEAVNNYICSAFYKDGACGLCFADISTGEVNVKTAKNDGIINEFTRYNPSELIFNAAFLDLKTVLDFVKEKMRCTVTLRDDESYDVAKKKPVVLAHFDAVSANALDIGEGVEAAAVCGLFDYIGETQKTVAGRFTEITRISGGEYMELDMNARRNLELSATIRSGDKRGSLLGVLDMTKTSMGKRLLRSYIEKPLLSPVRIIERLEAVNALCANSVVLWDIADLLGNVYDTERLMTRVVYKTASPADLKALSLTALQMPELKAHLEKLTNSEVFGSKLLTSLNEKISDTKELAALIENAIQDEPSKNIRDGDVIKDGFNPELDRLRGIIKNGNGAIDEMLEREKERTGIKNLKIGYNRVFGYYIEVTRSYYSLIPENYERKQTLANCERFITEELKQTEYDIMNAKQKTLDLELEIFNEVRDFAASQLGSVRNTAAAIAVTDVLCSFAAVSLKNLYVKPEIAIDGVIEIKDGRHPVVEALQKDDVFVPNDAYLDTKANRMSIITGPNMSGKSTYMRQVAVIALMAQIGCFVPASYAKISVSDRIFTRVGASDDLSSGQSTFMVEMSEVAEILKHATVKSLVILDEVGRGTSTYDGLSIARSVAEYIAKKLGCKTMFATHYHELIRLADETEGVKNLSVAVKKHGGSVKFLRKIVNGGTDDSYGIEVAGLAGLPAKVIARAKTLLAELEEQNEQNKRGKPDASAKKQTGFSALREGEITEKLLKINTSELTDEECREVLENLVMLIDN